MVRKITTPHIHQPSKSFDKILLECLEAMLRIALITGTFMNPLRTMLEGGYLKGIRDAFRPRVSNNKNLEFKYQFDVRQGHLYVRLQPLRVLAFSVYIFSLYQLCIFFIL